MSRSTAVTPILLYHSISTDADRQDLPFTVTPAQFGDQVAMIAASGIPVMTMGELMASRRSHARGARVSALVITCDDGYADTADTFAQMLLAAGLRATVYVSTATVDTDVRGKRMISWSQVEDLDREGFEVGSHGHHHIQLDTCRITHASAEVGISRQRLEDHLGAAPTTFAYPHGYHSPRVVEVVQQSGFSSACAVKNQLSHPNDERFALARMTITRSTGMDGMARILRGEGPVATRHRRLTTRAWRTARYFDQLTKVDVQCP